ncbi:hypothetical protein DPEC_G00253770 [Dallia pectoralis]|uniref:Uncharacterized protein n=1 Tax=Dallia pectoralis TaxID=75939 RepID=A0ACC2FTW5_DALPE|nr:hypothetical protein DPEC_G00253770 [Dallia pectoralis]
MAKPQDMLPQEQPGGLSDLEIISQPDMVEELGVEEINPSGMAPVQLLSFGYRDLPLAHLDLSLAGSQLLSNLDEDDNRDGSNWLKPCCGRRVALWQVCLLSAGFNCILVALVILVVVFLTVELLIDTRHLQFSNAFQFASIIHWISLAVLSLFFTETVFRIVVFGIWDYIENKVEVFDGAVIVLSLAPMVASTVANGPSSPWDAISLIITLRIWRVKRIIDAYVLQVKVEMEMEIQQCEKTKAIREEQLERLTQICQEQAFEIRQLRAHLAQQDLDLAAEREAAMQIHHVWGKQSSSYQVVEGQGPGESDDEGRGDPRDSHNPADPVVHHDDMNNYISQYYSEQCRDTGDLCAITTADIDVHHPKTLHPAHNKPLLDVERIDKAATGRDTCASISQSSGSVTARPHCLSSQTIGSSNKDRSGTNRNYNTQGTDFHFKTKARGPFLNYKSQKQMQARDYDTEEHNTRGRHCFPLPYCGPLGLGLKPALPALPMDHSMVVQELLSSLSEDSCLAQKGLVDPVNLKLPSPAGSAKTSPELEHRVNIYNRKNQSDTQYQGQNQGPATVLLQTKPLIHLQGRSSESSLEEKYRLLGPADGLLERLPDT